jgi:hypothetical protein
LKEWEGGGKGRCISGEKNIKRNKDPNHGMDIVFLRSFAKRQ